MRVAGAAAVMLAALAVSIPTGTGRTADRTARVTSQCLADETLIYSCRFGSRLASVCTGSGQVHLRSGPRGKSDLDIVNASDWSNVRIGMVAGQMGGSQHHIRFTQGDAHYIVLHGIDGQMAERPGRTYSGIVTVYGPNGEWEGSDQTCRRGAVIHPQFEEAVAALAPEALRDGLVETEGEAFDGWF